MGYPTNFQWKKELILCVIFIVTAFDIIDRTVNRPKPQLFLSFFQILNRECFEIGRHYAIFVKEIRNILLSYITHASIFRQIIYFTKCVVLFVRKSVYYLRNQSLHQNYDRKSMILLPFSNRRLCIMEFFFLSTWLIVLQRWYKLRSAKNKRVGINIFPIMSHQ